MATNDFKPFAVAGGANVMTQSDYLALAALGTGFTSGTAASAQLNKVWRQSSIMSAMLAQFIVDNTGQNAVDDGTIATLEANLSSAIQGITPGRLLNVQVFLSSGTYTPTPGTKSVIVEVQGGGGAGGGTPVPQGTVGSGITGGGGAGGNYAKSRYTSGFAGVAVTVGAGGQGVVNGNGGTGGTSSFGGALICGGGGGGAASVSSSSSMSISRGGTPSTLITGANIYQSQGETGHFGVVINGAYAGGEGGSSIFGAGGTSSSSSTPMAPSTPVVTLSPGAGGSSSCGQLFAPGEATAASAGNPGAGGVVTVWEFA